jgi:mannose-6-phosphate isomerase-like protein (cupin superfamily)
MKLVLTFAGLLTVVVLPALAQSRNASPLQPPASGPAATVSFVDHDKVAAALAKGGSLVTAANLTGSGNHRMGPGQVEVHALETDIFYITDGEATIVTGGTMVGGKETGPGQVRGTDVQGGETRHLVKGDVMVIPAGIPHWFKEVSPTINYLTVKVIKQSGD